MQSVALQRDPRPVTAARPPTLQRSLSGSTTHQPSPPPRRKPPVATAASAAAAASVPTASLPVRAPSSTSSAAAVETSLCLSLCASRSIRLALSVSPRRTTRSSLLLLPTGAPWLAASASASAAAPTSSLPPYTTRSASLNGTSTTRGKALCRGGSLGGSGDGALRGYVQAE